MKSPNFVLKVRSQSTNFLDTQCHFLVNFVLFIQRGKKTKIEIFFSFRKITLILKKKREKCSRNKITVQRNFEKL